MDSKHSRGLVMISTVALTVTALVVACSQGGETPVTGDPDGTGLSDLPARPAGAPRFGPPLASFGEATLLETKVAAAAPTSPAIERPTIATPPLPSAELAAQGGGSGRGAPGGMMASAAESSGAPMAAAPPPSPAMPSAAPPSAMMEESAAPARRARAASSGVFGAESAPSSVAASDMPSPTKSLPMGLGSYNQPQRRQLTAGAVADVDHREAYLGYLQRHAGEAASLRLDLSRRVRFMVVDDQRRPIHDARITLVGGDDRPVLGRTHGDGIWDFFPSISAPQLQGQVSVYVQSGALSGQATIALPAYGDGGSYVMQLAGPGQGLPRRLDLAFLIDVTGSMGDELRYINDEITGIVEQVRRAVPNTEVRVASTFYRDRSDSVPIEQIPFSSDVSEFVARMSFVQATGGGDYPEDLNSGLAAAMNTLRWTEEGAARVLVVIADAPPQNYGDAQYEYHQALADAARRGVRLLPVAASGSNDQVEFLFRAMGAFTSTPYTYLTDDSGIGNSHQEADSDHVSREMFSVLLTRLLIAELQGEGMH